MTGPSHPGSPPPPPQPPFDLPGLLAYDEAAWADAVARLSPRIRRHLAHLLSSTGRIRDRDDVVDDLHGEVWSRAVLKVGQFRGAAAQFPAWIATMTVFVYREYARGAKRRRERGPAAYTELLGDLAPAFTEDAVLQRLTADEILALGKFDPEMQRMVWLYLSGYTPAEIIQVVKSSRFDRADSAGRAIRRAFATLRAIIRERYQGG